MANFFVRRSNQFKVRNAEYKPWNMTDVIEAFGGGKSFEQVKAEQKELREKKEK